MALVDFLALLGLGALVAFLVNLLLIPLGTSIAATLAGVCAVIFVLLLLL